MAIGGEWIRRMVPARVMRWPRWVRYSTAGFVVLIIIGASVSSPSKKPTSQPAAVRATTTLAPRTTAPPTSATSVPSTTVQPTTTSPRPTATTAAPTTVPTTISASEKAQVQSILTAALTHYTSEFSVGEAAVNKTNNDFYDWRHSTNIETDVQTYITAFKQADAFYNANDEPPAIGIWRDDIGTLQGDISSWIYKVVDWQTDDATDSQLAQADQTVHSDIVTVQSDIQKVLEGQ